MPIPDSQGTTFTFNGQEFEATMVKTSSSVNELDASTLKLPSGSMRAYQPAPLVDGDTISCQYFGIEKPDMATVHDIACATLGITGKALCTKFENEVKVGELITGSAEFRLSAG